LRRASPTDQVFGPSVALPVPEIVAGGITTSSNKTSLTFGNGDEVAQ